MRNNVLTSKFPRVTIGALKGGSGKTIISAGIAAAMNEDGMNIRTFKKGPDFIDTSWLAAASGKPCYNLDTFMMGENGVLATFLEKSEGVDLSIIEGNRGLFDGMDQEGSQSTARLAEIVSSPVILVVDASKSTRTVAAMVHGCMTFDGGCNIQGVILNRVAGIRHHDMVKRSVEKYCGIPVIGAVPKLDDILPERHMGLIPPQETGLHESIIKKLSVIMKECIDIDAVIAIAGKAVELDVPETVKDSREGTAHGPRIGIFRDSAFQFYYEENLEGLQNCGAELVEISPVSDAALPDVDALYIGGGFPETHAKIIHSNISFRDSIRAAVERGMPVYAECGGIVYLGRKLSMDGNVYDMAGILPLEFFLENKPGRHGYTLMEAINDNSPFFEKGAVLKGHEFHYTKVVNWKESGLKTTIEMKRGHGMDGRGDGILYGSVFGMYNHIHVKSVPGWAKAIVSAAESFRDERNASAAL